MAAIRIRFMGIGREEGAKDSALCTVASQGIPIDSENFLGKTLARKPRRPAGDWRHAQISENPKVRRACSSIPLYLQRLLFVQFRTSPLPQYEAPMNTSPQ